MRRRAFIAGLGGAVALWPLAVRGQTQNFPAIGYLSDGAMPADLNYAPFNAFRQGLKEVGYIEGQNLTVAWRFAGGRSDLLRDYAAELARPPIAAIWASGSLATLAAKAATATTPIVFSMGDDPVAAGLVSSLSHPQGNLTGVTYVAGALPTKRLELLRELLPKISTVGFLINPNNRNAERDTAAVKAAAAIMGLSIVVVNASADSDFEAAFATLVQSGAGALLINNDIFLFSRRKLLIELTARDAIPAINPVNQYASEGGLMGYGANTIDSQRQVGVYVGRILKGAKPADLPVLQPTKFELVINLKTAKALGLTIPEAFLLRADQVIE